MKIKLRLAVDFTLQDAESLAGFFRLLSRVSEFSFDVTVGQANLQAKLPHVSLTVVKVRKKKAEQYCGSHPSSCDIRPRGGKHRLARCLEGGDWIRFNDLVNDVLDCYRSGVDAHVATAVCEIRRGRQRRIRYGEYLLEPAGTYEWTRYGLCDDYADHCGVLAPRSKAPAGTPGLPVQQSIQGG